VIENLAALQEIDRRNRERELELADIEREIATQQALLDEKRLTVETLRTELATVGARRRDLEGQLSLEEQRMKERRMRLGRLRNDKEVAALQREIELAKETNARLEEEVLTLIEQVEALEGSLRGSEEELKAVADSLAKFGEAGSGRVRQLRAEIEGDRSARSSIAGRLGDPLRKRYEQIFARRNGIAVVEVVRGNCRGCNMHLPPQLYIRIQRRVDVEFCPNCNRILYWRPEVTDGAGADER
jgi:predicted  nucleic acid-binding Zn-ribbon protein